MKEAVRTASPSFLCLLIRLFLNPSVYHFFLFACRGNHAQPSHSHRLASLRLHFMHSSSPLTIVEGVWEGTAVPTEMSEAEKAALVHEQDVLEKALLQSYYHGNTHRWSALQVVRSYASLLHGLGANGDAASLAQCSTDDTESSVENHGAFSSDDSESVSSETTSDATVEVACEVRVKQPWTPRPRKPPVCAERTLRSCFAGHYPSPSRSCGDHAQPSRPLTPPKAYAVGKVLQQPATHQQLLPAEWFTTGIMDYLALPVHERLRSPRYLRSRSARNAASTVDGDDAAHIAKSRMTRGAKVAPTSFMECGNGTVGSTPARHDVEAFLSRVDENRRRSAAKEAQLRQELDQELTFKPKLAPLTENVLRRSAVRARRTACGEGTEAATRSPRVSATATEDLRRAEKRRLEQVITDQSAAPFTPRINRHSRRMRRTVSDLHLYEQVRQRHREQLRQEQEVEQAAIAPLRPSLNPDSERMLQDVLGSAVSHHAIQRHLDTHQWQRQARLQQELAQKEAEGEQCMTFSPETHSLPAYIRELAKEVKGRRTCLQANPFTEKPPFRF